MADEKSNAPNPRRKRPAPTIDLSATEVTSAEPSQTAHESSAAGEKTEMPPSGKQSQGNRPLVLGIVAGGIAGAAAVLGGLWLGGLLPPHQTPDNVSSRVAALEAQMKAAAKPGNDQPIADLTARVGKLEQTAAKPAPAATDPALAERLTGVENAMKALGVTLTALNRRAEDSAKTTEALQSKIDALEQAAKTAQDKIAQNSGADAVARRAVVAASLRDAVSRGAPYAAELAVVKQFGADAESIAALEPFAASGVPTETKLSRELSDLLPQMIKASGADAGKAGGFFERLQANAGKLVRIHPVGEPSGDDPSAVLARIEVKAAHNDLAGAAAELDKLPPQTRSLAESWRKKIAARNAALAASRKLAADSTASLGSP
jgi:hypothetical protein